MSNHIEAMDTLERERELAPASGLSLAVQPARTRGFTNSNKADKLVAVADDDQDGDDERSFVQRHWIGLCIGLAVMIGLIVCAVHVFSGASATPRREQAFTMVSLAPPPPPPPPPPTPPQAQTPPEEKMIEQTPVAAEEPKPDEPPAPSPDLGTGVKGNGPPDGFGLNGSRGNGLIGSRNAGNNGSRWGWYAGQVQTKIAEALRNHHKTRSAGLAVQVRVWPDAVGRITRVQLVSSTGNKSMDDAIQNEVLTGLQLQEPPPPGMPAPIVLRLNARRPN